ncbi:protein piccolo [Colossoma macropomum]|uniref:protein piccolo n=1 Tax=Colossoma macropomum TaxID=42526 RepID=UPI0018656B37|nr:protein piccolo [Colossoma macropomum]XP_036419277.1 protein piccolo [Colossoma macropomum]
MKPDDVATVPAEPTEAPEAAAIAEEAATEEQLQEESPSPPQHEEPKNLQEGADSIAPPPEKKTNSKTSQPANKTKAPVKNKPSTAVTKTTTSAASRSAPAQNRVANGVTRTAANGATKRPATAASEAKKTVPVGAAAQAKKGPAATVALRTPTKVAERKPVGTTRPAVASTNSGTKPGAVANATASLGKKPATASNSAAVKPKTTAPRPATAPAAKPSVSTTSRTAPGTKTTRPTAPHSTTSSASIRPTVTTTKPASSRTVSAPSAARSASLQPSKASTTTAAAKKDVGKPSTSAPARKLNATKTSTQPTATKTSKPEPLKTAAAAKRPPPDTKTARLKADGNKSVPTRKVPPSPRNIASRPASSKTATASHSQKQGGSSTPVAVKRQTSKPTQSVSPLVIKGKSTEEQAAETVEPSSASLATVSAATTTPLAAVESVPEVEATSAVQLEEQPDEQISAPVEVQEDEVVQMPASGTSDIEIVPTVQQDDIEPLAIQPEAEVPSPEVSSSASVPFGEEFQKDDEDYISVNVPAEQEVTQLLQEPVMAPPFELCVADPVPPKGMEVIEKAEQLIHNDVDEEEEEKEGSQQVSVSDMSGTQPTEESRPGSAGLTGSVWRAGGLLSEPDSEDVSCSQQGASELSAPGVLEGTESMDDLGEASLKGADAEGASAGSPDFEKVPDIPANEEDEDDDYDDEDRVCDMEVGSERAEDPHRQCPDNEDEEDEDVEMASEGITESGLESYGNADEDDFAEDYRLDNLNRMQPPPIVPSAPPAAQWDQPNLFADPWAQPLQPDPTLSSPSSSPWQPSMETPIQAPHQGWLDVENAKGGPSCQSPALIEPILSSPQLAPVPSAEDASFNPGLAPHPQGMSLSNTSSGPEQAAHSFSDTSTPEELKDYNVSPGLENQQQQPAPVSPVPAALPDIMQDLGIQLEQGDEEEEPENLPADVLGGPATAPTSLPSSPSSATEDEASDTEGEMQISESNVEPVATGKEGSGSTQVAHSLSTLEEREDACVETEGGGGSDTPQSATSAASYGFDCTTTSNSNAQSTTESCAKSPGIFSLENEEQLPEEAKDPSLIKELNLQPTCASGDIDQLHLEQQGDLQPNSEQQYMLCGKASEELPEPCSQGGTVPVEEGLVNPSSPQHQEEDWDLDAQHPYYSTICEKTDSSLAGRNNRHQQEVLTIHMTMSPKRRPRPHVDHVTNPPRLPTDLPPRIPSVGPNAQLRRLEHHQQQLRQIEQRREEQSQWVESQEEERIGEKEHEANDCNSYHGDEKTEERNQMEEELEEKRMREEKEKELEEQRRDLLQLQIQQQQQELKQRQQIMQWQQELEQQQNKHPNKQHKTVTKVLLSPSGLGTIYEALEMSDAEEDLEDEMEEKEMVKEDKAEYKTPKELCSKTEATKDPPQDNTSPMTQSTCSLKFIQDQVGLTHPAAPDSPPLNNSEQPSPLELDWGKKVDIVQQLINQTLLLAGDSCSPLLLLPGGAGGTLSPLETSLWPNLLPPLTPPSATVTSVSSFSPEASGSSQGEWTVVELETHH